MSGTSHKMCILIKKAECRGTALADGGPERQTKIFRLEECMEEGACQFWAESDKTVELYSGRSVENGKNVLRKLRV